MTKNLILSLYLKIVIEMKKIGMMKKKNRENNNNINLVEVIKEVEEVIQEEEEVIKEEDIEVEVTEIGTKEINIRKKLKANKKINKRIFNFEIIILH